MPTALEDLPSVRGISLRAIYPRAEVPPSSAAAAMLANPHERSGDRRLTPMPPATRQAALAHARERLELIDRTLAVINDVRVHRERRAWVTLFEHLGGEMTLFGPAPPDYAPTEDDPRGECRRGGGAPMSDTRAIGSNTIGQRHRKNMGDIKSDSRAASPKSDYCIRSPSVHVLQDVVHGAAERRCSAPSFCRLGSSQTTTGCTANATPHGCSRGRQRQSERWQRSGSSTRLARRAGREQPRAKTHPSE